MNNVVLKVEGMSCAHCQQAVSTAVSGLEGVGDVAVSLEEKQVTVSFDPSKVTMEQMKDAIEDQGFDVVE